jgi:CDP-diacylglycerol--serine O-phosphatidyltransferase
LLLGFFSILVSLRALRAGEPASSLSFVTACWLILWATIGDVLDGKLAKMLKASSDFGMRLDTFADAVTFGLAPAVLIYAAFLRDTATGAPAIGLAPAAYFLAACFRLARYNVASTGEPKFGFVGVPTPTAALIVTSLYLSTRGTPLPAAWVRALCGLVAVAMIWPLRYPAFKGLKGREAVLVLGILFTMLLSSLKWGIAPTILVAWGSFALVWGYWWIPLRPYWVPGVSKED